ncbi:hypothetical protein N7509_013067 [Penicillium cosmopolitanum]|uniref:FAD/NAD(P)-binding domain-containing protein n=1 Tax=Penicillium cosmopolitanum TaxID=1131564 RepID=A0A9W9VE94_9EURO|nr:uncharacterized protein N7509_013067 [Penicillium cosmopolitanum]KAJ5376181.1 hypothetical protein N7509_013067 [Penicillium cosmopolitanum]
MGEATPASATPSFDGIIIGAGISGINAAYRLASDFPDYRYAILEARDSIGGTWDLFRYPGIRSDSDLYTFGFPWYPWNQPNPIAEGKNIVAYLKDAATAHNITPHILFQHSVQSAEWDQQMWTIDVDHDGTEARFSAKFLIFGTGYYDYHKALQTMIPGIQDFQGNVIHPQFWPEDFDYTDKSIIVIGSGATAVTLVPNLAKKASRVTMLQRSPSYIFSLPNSMKRGWLSRILPTKIAYYFNRMWYLGSAQFMFRFSRWYPAAVRAAIEKKTSAQLPLGIPLNPHFNPRYNPWEQRLCLCPDGDFFKALCSGKAQVETGIIETIDSDGIQLTSGQRLSADTIITATGLKLQLAGGIRIIVNGEKFDMSKKYMWNGLMLQDLPNAAILLGYTNASWTLGADASMLSICRLLKLMESKGYSVACPDLSDSTQLEPGPILNLNSTYITRANEQLPKGASQRPWIGRANYFSDLYFAKFGDLSQGLKLSS